LVAVDGCENSAVHVLCVLLQLPMYNEEAHCEVVIERACNIIWPRDRIIIQVRRLAAQQA
jgi:hypothetical protein